MDSTNMTEKIETLKHTIDRYDSFYDCVNNKGNLYLALNTFLLGGMVAGYYAIKECVEGRSSVLFFVWIGLALCLFSIGFTLWAIIPYITKQADSVNGSVLFFGNVSNLSFTSFKKMYEDMTDEKTYEDYLQQVHLLALGLQNKFRRLQIATYLLAGCFLCIIIVGIIIF